MDSRPFPAADGRKHQLSENLGLSPDQLKNLSEHWIVTVEDLISACATPDLEAGIAALLGIELPELRKLLSSCASLPGVSSNADLAVPLEKKPLGLLLTEEDRARFESGVERERETGDEK